MSELTFFKSGEVSAEIKRRLQTIKKADGSETDAGKIVFMGRRKVPADDETPCCQVFEGLDDVKDHAGRDPQVLIDQQYVIDSFVPCDADNPNDAALAAIRDIKKAIFAGPSGATWNRRVKSVKYLGRDIGPRADGAAIVQARVLISVEYVETLTDP